MHAIKPDESLRIMNTSTATNYLPKVREQYEALPYPPYDPALDRNQLVSTGNDRLDYLNHRFFDGRHTYGHDFRVLCAGDGTGNSSIFLAEQMAELGGQVVSLDLSSASQAIAKERARIRKLTNITHIHASLLDIPKLGLGEFDYISCSGVLHHLANPDDGLRTLAGALKPGGILGIMVYATIGRTGVYYMQELLRTLFEGGDIPMQTQLAVTRELLAELPRTNWFWLNNHAFMNDITQYGDSGIFDLLLHTQDRAYTVDQIYGWVARCGLKFAEFVPHRNHHSVAYNPMRHLKDPAVESVIGALPVPEQQAIAELVAGNIIMHTFYAYRGDIADELRHDDHSLIPNFGIVSPIGMGDQADVCNALRAAVGQPIATIRVPQVPNPIRLTPALAVPDIVASINGERTIAEILQLAHAAHPSLSMHDIIAQWNTLAHEMLMQQMVVYRRADGARILDALSIQHRSVKR